MSDPRHEPHTRAEAEMLGEEARDGDDERDDERRQDDADDQP